MSKVDDVALAKGMVFYLHVCDDTLFHYFY